MSVVFNINRVEYGTTAKHRTKINLLTLSTVTDGNLIKIVDGNSLRVLRPCKLNISCLLKGSEPFVSYLLIDDMDVIVNESYVSHEEISFLHDVELHAGSMISLEVLNRGKNPLCPLHVSLDYFMVRDIGVSALVKPQPVESPSYSIEGETTSDNERIWVVKNADDDAVRVFDTEGEAKQYVNGLAGALTTAKPLDFKKNELDVDFSPPGEDFTQVLTKLDQEIFKSMALPKNIMNPPEPPEPIDTSFEVKCLDNIGMENSFLVGVTYLANKCESNNDMINVIDRLGVETQCYANRFEVVVSEHEAQKREEAKRFGAAIHLAKFLFEDAKNEDIEVQAHEFIKSMDYEAILRTLGRCEIYRKQKRDRDIEMAERANKANKMDSGSDRADAMAYAMAAANPGPVGTPGLMGDPPGLMGDPGPLGPPGVGPTTVSNAPVPPTPTLEDIKKTGEGLRLPRPFWS